MSAPSPLRGGGPDPADERRFFTWGESVHLWNGRTAVRIATAPQGFDDGGCVMDANGDGRTDLILARRGPAGELGDLVLLAAPAFTPIVIDTYVALHDCLPATLFGRRGFLMVHRDAQVRFYEPPAKAGAAWANTEIYSIYTASRQAGLSLADVNGDGRVDIYCGNYWIQSPASFDLPWHIFAINLHHQTASQASFRFAGSAETLFAVQREEARAPLRVFRRPENPEKLWPETVWDRAVFDRPGAILRYGDFLLIGDASGLAAIGLDASQSQVSRVSEAPVIGMWRQRDRIYLLSPSGVSVWRWRR